MPQELEVRPGRGGDLVFVHELVLSLLLGDEHGAEVAPVALERGGDVVVERGRLLHVPDHVVGPLRIPGASLRLHLVVLVLGDVLGCLLWLFRVRLTCAVALLLGSRRDQPRAVGPLLEKHVVLFLAPREN